MPSTKAAGGGIYSGVLLKDVKVPVKVRRTLSSVGTSSSNTIKPKAPTKLITRRHFQECPSRHHFGRIIKKIPLCSILPSKHAPRVAQPSHANTLAHTGTLSYAHAPALTGSLAGVPFNYFHYWFNIYVVAARVCRSADIQIWKDCILPTSHSRQHHWK